MTGTADVHRVVVVGGGAGGLELATRLGRKLGRKGRAHVTLVDRAWTHMWKPLLHEVAAGTLDVHEDELEYLAQAHHNGFAFRLGRMTSIDRTERKIVIAATLDEHGVELIPERRLGYDTLVLAVGSVSNDFGVPGVREHCLFLDTTEQAERFQERLLATYLRAHAHGGPAQPAQLHVAIVGAGATGVELAAQLYAISRALTAYGLHEIVPERDIAITLVEAAPRILPALPDHLAEATTKQLERLGVKVMTGEQVTSVDETGIHTKSGAHVPAGTRVWAAGIRAPAFLAELDGLESNRLGQLVVTQTLQATRDENIFAIGDCAACPWPGHEGNVPPRAQAAHQQASCVARSVVARTRGEAPRRFVYSDYGSLVSLGRYSTVGSLMGNLFGRVSVEGAVARLFYLSLYKMHQVALFGLPRVAFLTVANIFRRAVHPRIKLH